MSVRFRFVKRLEMRVRNRLPTVCQKNCTRFSALPRKREPYTTSARPASIGFKSAGYSAGSYSRSASWMRRISPRACAIAVVTARPFPMLCGWEMTLTPSRPSHFARMSRVPSTEPSSTTRISLSIGTAETSRSTSSIVRASLYTGIRTDSFTVARMIRENRLSS